MATESYRTNTEQQRAEFAFKSAQKGAALNKNSEYKAYVKKMPMLIKTNGLGAALAFAFAKGAKGGIPNESDAWGLIYSQIQEWLEEKDIKKLLEGQSGTLAKKLTQVESSLYRAATVEVLALLSWTRRFSDGLID